MVSSWCFSRNCSRDFSDIEVLPDNFSSVFPSKILMASSKVSLRFHTSSSFQAVINLVINLIIPTCLPPVIFILIGLKWKLSQSLSQIYRNMFLLILLLISPVITTRDLPKIFTGIPQSIIPQCLKKFVRRFYQGDLQEFLRQLLQSSFQAFTYDFHQEFIHIFLQR